MEAHLADWIKDTPRGREAESILRSCVHCGFCTATCPTYLLLGDELDGPRGRIYLIKQVLEGNEVTPVTQLHLDRCLTCRNCETTCPSGVRYGRLVDIGREVVAERLPRKPVDALKRAALRQVLPRRRLFALVLEVGRWLRPFLPSNVRSKLPPTRPAEARPIGRHARKMVAMTVCVQDSLAPNIDAAAARVLDRLGIELVHAPAAGCCGALRFHLDDHQGAKQQMRCNVQQWSRDLDAGAETIVSTASGCGAMVREYGHVLRGEPEHAAAANRVSDATRDLSEIIAAEMNSVERLLKADWPADLPKSIAFHPPCTLQHGQQIRGVVERILTAVGFELTRVRDPHLCCGSAGTYSILHPDIAVRLRDDKLRNLQAGGAQAIASANIGCLTHLASGTTTPVMHWIELLDRRMATAPST